jgi:AcrR family transcriptional regulator
LSTAEGDVKPLRADAQRNYDAVVAAAREAFAARGTQASLDDIADHAGVGNATLYRHFPMRDSLVVEALRFPLAELSAIARELGESKDAGVAFRAWVTELATFLTHWHGLAETVALALRDEESPLTIACQPLQLSTFKLLTKAQDAGAARADLTAPEVFSLVAAVSWGAQGADGVGRLVDILFAGIAPMK